MRSASARITVLNSLLFIRDPKTHDLPTIDGESAFWSTPSCIAVGCLPDSDGATEVTIGPEEEVALPSRPSFECRLKTPSYTIIVETVLAEVVLQVSVPQPDTRIRIWINGSRDPDTVIIGVQ